jgi:peptide/nickel transport system ATP-binding protein
MSSAADKGASVGTAVRMKVEDLRIVMSGSGVEVVDQVSLQLAAGRTLGLVGESGSGKTTVGLALLGYARRGLEIERGRVVLDGTDILAMPEDERRKLRGGEVAYVPQDPGTALNPSLTVGYQLAEVTKQHGESTAEHLDELMERLSLPKERIRRSYPHQLSGGQQQRVALTMAFARRPRVIVLDEPTTGLDVTVQNQVLEAIRELCATYDVSGVFVSHDLAVVSELVDEVAVMYAGRIVECGNCRTMFAAPAHPYTRGLLRAVPAADHTHTLHGMEGRPPRPGNRPRGCVFAPRCELQIPECSAAEPALVSAAATPQDPHVARCIRVDVSRNLGRGKESEGVLAAGDASSAGSVLLSALDVHAMYGDTEVLHGVSLVVRPSECVAVVGESGSGKTTMARCIVGLHQVSQGEMSLEGKPLAPAGRQRDPQQLRALQYIFQNPFASLNPRKSIREILELPLRRFYDLPRDERQKHITRALEDVALSRELLTALPHQLSGGERQRVAIARALVVEPKVLVCDEITSALDVSVQAAIIEMLRRLQAERSLSMVFITHNLALVRSIAAQVLVLKDGSVVEAGATAEVLDSPEAEYTKRLLDDLPRLRTAQ